MFLCLSIAHCFSLLSSFPLYGYTIYFSVCPSMLYFLVSLSFVLIEHLFYDSLLPLGWLICWLCCIFLEMALRFIPCCSVAHLYPTFCDSMDYSTPGFPFLHVLLELAQTHFHLVGDAIQPSHPLSFLLLLTSVFSSIRVFFNKLTLCIRRVKVLVAQLCPTLVKSMDCSPPGSSVHGIFQARILEEVVILFSMGSS